MILQLFSLLLIFVSFVEIVKCLNDDDILPRAQSLAIALAQLENTTLRVNDLEEMFDRADYEESPVQPDALADSLAKSIMDLLTVKEWALRNISVAALEAVKTATSGAEASQCTLKSAYQPIPAADSNEEAASRFNVSAISLKYGTIRSSTGKMPADSDVKATICSLQDPLNSAYKLNNERDPLLTWQYMGTQDGLMLMYPGAEEMKSGSIYQKYDPRVRAWYSAAAGGPRDVLLVLDKSGSMVENNRLALMKSAAHAVLDTLSARDYVQVVLFSSNAATSPCLPDHMVRATPENIKVLRSYIDDVQAGGGTNFEAALTLAFALIAETKQQSKGTKCRTALLFLTDGKETEGDATEIIANGLRDSDGKPIATIFSYALGADAELRSGIACESGGTFAVIEDGGNLQSSMSSYFQLFAQGMQLSDGGSGDIVWSAPYLDSSGLGMMITASTPVYQGKSDGRNKLIGVAGVDVVLTELSSLMQKVEGEHSYSFAVNNAGEVIFHPQLRRNTVYTDPPVYVDISTLEVSVVPGAFSEVRDGLLSGEAGSATVEVERRVDRGDSAYEGYSTTAVRTTYTWRPAGPLTVCVVIAEGEALQAELRNASSSFRSVYHRSLLNITVASELGFAQDPPANPVHGQQKITHGTATVKLAPRAFEDTAGYLSGSRDTSLSAINDIQRYFDDSAAPNVGFVQGVREDVMRSGDASGLWSEVRDEAESQGVIWTYVGTPFAVRIFPGFVHPNALYDPTLRTWYKRAFSNLGEIALSTPYIDAFGAGRVITLSRTVRKRFEDSDQAIGGVAGLDVSFSTFAALVRDAAQCAGTASQDLFCFTMDSSGYLISYEGQKFNFSAIPSWQESENIFVGEHEPTLTQELIDSKFLLQREYYDARSEQDCSTYVVNQTQASLVQNGFVTGTMTGCIEGTYRVAPVQNLESGSGMVARTNLYLVTIQQYRVKSTCFEKLAAKCGAKKAPSCDESKQAVVNAASVATETCPAYAISEEALEALRLEETGKTCADVAEEAGIGTGGIIGIVVGIIAGIAVIALLIFCCMRRSQSSPSTAAAVPPAAREPAAPATRQRQRSFKSGGGAGGSSDLYRSRNRQASTRDASGGGGGGRRRRQSSRSPASMGQYAYVQPQSRLPPVNPESQIQMTVAQTAYEAPPAYTP